MKIAITAMDNNQQAAVDPRFGRAKWFILHDTEKATWEAFDNTQNLQATQGAGIQAAANVVNTGCTVLISGHCGPKAFRALAAAGVAVFCLPGECTVRKAVDVFMNGTLAQLEGADVEGHW